MKTKLIILSLLLLMCFSVFAACNTTACNHKGGNPDCLTAAKCIDCGESYFGDHNFVSGVCSICDLVGVTSAQSFQYTIKDDKVTITKFIGDETRVIIPDTIEDCPVIAIGEEAFNGDSSGSESKLKSVKLGKNITSIGNRAFFFCKNLTSLNLTAATNLTQIGDYAFSQCTGLQNFVLPGSLRIIGEGTFTYVSEITSITIPALVTDIGRFAFRACANLSSMQVDSKNIVYRSAGNTIITKSDNILIAGCNASVIPNNVSAIGDYAFANCSQLTSIEIPDSVTLVGNYAFISCGLISITIPDSVQNIGIGAFYACVYLKEVSIGSGVATISEEMFTSCFSLETITIPDTVLSIDSGAFNSCIGLVSVVIGSGVATIAEDAFYYYSTSSLNAMFYKGSRSDWNNIDKGYIPSHLIYYFLEQQPDDTYNYWCYDEDDLPAIWETIN